jgi:hypothetical protein
MHLNRHLQREADTDKRYQPDEPKPTPLKSRNKYIKDVKEEGDGKDDSGNVKAVTNKKK